MKGSCPRPLDEGDSFLHRFSNRAPAFLFGGGKRDRTADLLHAMQALSQLSYTPYTERIGDYTDAKYACKAIDKFTKLQFADLSDSMSPISQVFRVLHQSKVYVLPP